MRKDSIMMTIIFTTIALSACSSGQNAKQDANPPDHHQLVRYETQKEKQQRLQPEKPSIAEQGGYPQTEQKGVDSSYFSNYTDPFTDEESLYLTRELQKRKDIIQAQVVSQEDRLLIGVLLPQHFDQDITLQELEDEVRRILPENEKEIIIYTNNAQWNYLKNKDARIEYEEGIMLP